MAREGHRPQRSHAGLQCLSEFGPAAQVRGGRERSSAASACSEGHWSESSCAHVFAGQRLFGILGRPSGLLSLGQELRGSAGWLLSRSRRSAAAARLSWPPRAASGDRLGEIWVISCPSPATGTAVAPGSTSAQIVGGREPAPALHHQRCRFRWPWRPDGRRGRAAAVSTDLSAWTFTRGRCRDSVKLSARTGFVSRLLLR